MTLGIIGILLSLVLLMVLAYRGISVIILAPLMALVAVLAHPEMPVLASYTQVFMPALGRFIAAFFPLFLLGAVFGKLLEDTGSTAAIAGKVVDLLGANRALWAIVLSCGILTYGGVSVFVVVFAVYPLGTALLRRADIPKRLLPAAITFGSFTFAMTALPGSLQMHNLIPMKFFHTTAFAAPGLGLIGGLVMLALGLGWLSHRARAAARAGEGYGTGHRNETVAVDLIAPPRFWTAIAPIAAVIVLNFIFTEYVIPRWDAAYLAEPRFGATTLAGVRGIWATILALLCAIVLLVALHYHSRTRLNESLTTGAMSSMLPIFNTASEVGYGATIAALAGFAAVRDKVLAIAPANPLISESVSINVLSGITGSASGGLTIALEALGATFLQRGLDAGISPELLHRVATLSCSGLDTMPHNGAVITVLIICGLTHRQSYLDVGVTTVAVPIIATVVVITLGTLFGSF